MHFTVCFSIKIPAKWYANVTTENELNGKFPVKMWVRIHRLQINFDEHQCSSLFFWWCQPHKKSQKCTKHMHTYVHAYNKYKIAFTANPQQIFSVNEILFIAWCLCSTGKKVCSLFGMFWMSFNVCICVVLSVCHQFCFCCYDTGTHTQTLLWKNQ